jgi:hypothetical protein
MLPGMMVAEFVRDSMAPKTFGIETFAEKRYD